MNGHVITVSVKVDPEKLRRMAEGHREDQVADGRTVPVEEIERELLDGWGSEIAQYGAEIWPDLMVAAHEVTIYRALVAEEDDGW